VGTGFAVGHGRPPLVLVCGAVERGAAVEVVGGVDVGTSTAAEEAQRGMRGVPMSVRVRSFTS